MDQNKYEFSMPKHTTLSLSLSPLVLAESTLPNFKTTHSTYERHSRKQIMLHLRKVIIWASIYYMYLHIQIPPTSVLGLILRSTAVATATVSVPLRVL